MKIKQLIKNISPFNNNQDMPKVLYIIKKVLAFFFVYALGMGVAEGIVIVILYALGYNPLMGDMPMGHTADLIKYYGFAVFSLVTLLYCKFIEKEKLTSIGFNKKFSDYIIGGLLAVALLLCIVGTGCATGGLSFEGFGSNINVVYLVALFGAFIIQSLTEEIMCRGFLLTSLLKKTSLPTAVLVSSTAFALLHVPSMLEADIQFAIAGIVNIYLVSIAFSLLYIIRANIYIVGGLHCVWNFVLGGVMGLSVSGGNSNSNALMSFQVNSESLLNGGIYGLEASVVTTVALGIVVFILVKLCHKKGIENGF